MRRRFSRGQRAAIYEAREDYRLGRAVGRRVDVVDIVGYGYRAATYCPGCVLVRVLEREGLQGHGLSCVTEDALNLLARFRGIDREDERSFDSGDFPKVELRYQAEDAGAQCNRCGFVLADVLPGPHVWETDAPELAPAEV